MHHHHQRLSLPTLLLSVALLTACSSTPQHTNTLIFGTSTRMALDVSQEASGIFGVTIGYKRNEAVWMPLLANQVASAGGKLTPADCAPRDGKDDTTYCPKFLGKGGEKDVNGAGAQDTYSVIATFTGDMGGGVAASASAPQATGNAKVAQYFATGLAARLLAEKAGAAAVSGSASSPVEVQAKVSADDKKAAAEQESRASIISTRVSKTDDSINSAVLEKLLTAEPASKLKESTKAHIKSYKNRLGLQSYLADANPSVVSALWQALDTP